MTKFERTGGHNRAPLWLFHQKQDCTNPVGMPREGAIDETSSPDPDSGLCLARSYFVGTV
ncbi:hypothetical protein PspLS_07358 [Pyricularia sp. CBS 133598]|nr:hypothetical protein PspLS_07358 [Pyricularia sp. CBS 133598]